MFIGRKLSELKKKVFTKKNITQPAKFSQQPYGNLVIRNISRIKWTPAIQCFFQVYNTDYFHLYLEDIWNTCKTKL